MHKILNRTHRTSNINILKARDYYFDRARLANNVFRSICLLAPITLSVGGMLVGTIVNISDSDAWLDVSVGIVAIVSFIADIVVQYFVRDELDKSNVLREEYDCRVLGIKKNLFYGDNSKEKIDALTKVAECMPDGGKYEVWYRETFSDDDFVNALCLCMDNTIYTFHVYSAYKKRIRNKLILMSACFALYTLWYWTTPDDYFVAMVHPFVLFVALFDWIKDLVSAYVVSQDQIASAGKVVEYVKENRDEILSDYESHETVLRSIEDIVYNNRQQSLFIPKKIRNQFLRNDCAYYKDLDEIKKLYWGFKVKKPERPEDFEVPSSVTGADPSAQVENECMVVHLGQVHEKLLGMLDDIKKVFDENGIRFMLDGGTLIGAMRKSNAHSFLAWDDDVDISIRTSDVDKAMESIRNAYPDKYIVQDYDSERFYSPRLSRFRVRQLNNESFIDEKDSELFELYKSRGLFLDVYAYSPILVNVWVDSLYRRLFIHPLHKRIRKTERAWKTSGKRQKVLARFLKEKAQYMKRAKWYKEHATCTDYYSYEPHYIENLQMPGPYIKGEDLYGQNDADKRTTLFENREFEIPVNSNNVLAAFYGKDWEKSPYVPIDAFKTSSSGFDEHMYSKDTFDASCYKHIKSAYIKDSVYAVEK